MVGTAISVVTTVSGPTVILSTLLAHRVVYNVVRLVLNTVIKMQKNEFCLNFYTNGRNTKILELKSYTNEIKYRSYQTVIPI
ncbi:hypothetical protein, partial [Enterocloster clostridioformis]|uniref:hypothetical protein n=1 Tax=Enterocloster clostridioformis TaxID=1531 RepID=UPI001A9B51BD